ncbi:hypothetical protein MKX03_024782 [Papaver bracteatum]|nr:hypothetical protein MKX03_024782 [Papaver bracteatum]
MTTKYPSKTLVNFFRFHRSLSTSSSSSSTQSQKLTVKTQGFSSTFTSPPGLDSSSPSSKGSSSSSSLVRLPERRKVYTV